MGWVSRPWGRDVCTSLAALHIARAVCHSCRMRSSKCFPAPINSALPISRLFPVAVWTLAWNMRRLFVGWTWEQKLRSWFNSIAIIKAHFCLQRYRRNFKAIFYPKEKLYQHIAALCLTTFSSLNCKCAQEIGLFVNRDNNVWSFRKSNCAFGLNLKQVPGKLFQKHCW